MSESEIIRDLRRLRFDPANGCGKGRKVPLKRIGRTGRDRPGEPLQHHSAERGGIYMPILAHLHNSATYGGRYLLQQKVFLADVLEGSDHAAFENRQRPSIVGV